MDDNSTELIERVAAACQRIEGCLESQKVASPNEVKKLTDELRAAHKKISNLEINLEECEAETKVLKKTSHELAELRAARSRDLEEVAAIMSELRQLIGEGKGE